MTEGIALDPVTRWLSERIDGLQPPLDFTLIAGGHSNLTYRFVDQFLTKFGVEVTFVDASDLSAVEAVTGFGDWVDGFEPAAELDHPYLTGELRYGLPHPGPRWAAQLEAMELEAVRRSGVAFAELDADRQRVVVEAALERTGSDGLPGDPAQADHVALGLLAWFYGTSRANDLCYRASVGRHTCRGIGSLPDEPAPLEEA